jgi:metallophosphoesterase superfamily enzyme
LEKFVALYDLHWGYQRKNGHKTPLHDAKALKVALDYIKDFKPDHIILGGDMLDCGAISHHNHGKPGATEGLKLMVDAKELVEAVIKPIEATKPKSLTYIIGNHEAWVEQFVEKHPTLEGILNVESLLDLSSKWKIVPQGETHKLGKLIFMHGDQIKGGEHSAKWATVAWEANVRFGHHHTYQVYTKTSAKDANGHTGIAVPCLCKKDPAYGGGSPNRWVQGFQYGYVNGPDGIFNDYTAVIINGKSIIQGKIYK